MAPQNAYANLQCQIGPGGKLLEGLRHMSKQTEVSMIGPPARMSRRITEAPAPSPAGGLTPGRRRGGVSRSVVTRTALGWLVDDVLEAT